MKVECWFDGSCTPVNPGRVLGYGGLVKINGAEVYRFSDHHEFKELQSNNVAEYLALGEILVYLIDQRLENQHIEIFGDSQLVIRQMSGQYRIGKGMYRQAALDCKELKKRFKVLTFQWIPRDQNEDADALSTAQYSRPQHPHAKGHRRTEAVDRPELSYWLNKKRELSKQKSKGL